MSKRGRYLHDNYFLVFTKPARREVRRFLFCDAIAKQETGLFYKLNTYDYERND